MTDGASLEVPYYWKQSGEYKFYTSGGVAGIPQDQVASVQEILNSKPFDPATMTEASETTETGSPNRREEVLASQIPALPARSSATSGQAAAKPAASKKAPGAAEANIVRPLFTWQGDFSRVVRTEGNEQSIMLRNVLSSQVKLTPDKYRFRVTLYDGEGNKLETRDCELQKLNMSREALTELKARDNLYIVMATIKQDPRIKSYEISVLKP